MIWRYWPIKELQNEIGHSVLEKIDSILPAVDKNAANLFFLTNKRQLSRIQMAFAPEDYFNKSGNILKCLSFLPTKTMRSLIDYLDLNFENENEVDLSALTKLIIKESRLKRLFLRYFEISERFFPKANKPLASLWLARSPKPEYPIEIATPFKTLKPYQYDVYNRAEHKLIPPRSRLILQMPTGSGKTRTCMELIANHINSNLNQNCRVVWLANVEELCEQAIACFLEIWQHVGHIDVEIQRRWGKHPKPSELSYTASHQFIVASLQGLRIESEKTGENFKAIFSKTTLLIIDECHIAVAPTYSKIIKSITHLSGCRVLGLTATPGRFVEQETETLAELFFGSIETLKDPSGHNKNPIGYLRSKGVLSEVKYDPLAVDPNISLSKNELSKLESELDFAPSILEKLGQSSIRTIEIIERLKPLLELGSKIILFAPSVENSKFITALFTFLGFDAAHIDGETPTHSRGYYINQYIKGDIQILCNYGVLATGFDAPKTDILCIARPTKSTVLYSQMIGRGLRGPTIGGTSTCLVIEVKDNFLKQGTQDQLYSIFNNYWSQ